MIPYVMPPAIEVSYNISSPLHPMNPSSVLHPANPASPLNPANQMSPLDSSKSHHRKNHEPNSSESDEEAGERKEPRRQLDPRQKNIIAALSVISGIGIMLLLRKCF